MTPSDTFVVIPSYNEAKVICETITPLLNIGYCIVVVDDCSQDDTWQRICRLPVVALRHPINLGQGAALQTGMDFSLSHKARYIVHFDADGQHAPDQISRLLQPLIDNQADVTLGSRFLSSHDTKLVPFSKRMLLKCAVMVNFVFTGLLLSDAHNGFRALTADAATRIRLSENRFGHATELLEQIRDNRLRVIEVPTTTLYTSYSIRKGQPISNAANLLIELLLRRLLP